MCLTNLGHGDCFPELELGPLNEYPIESTFKVYLDLPFTCYGQVIGFQIFTKRRGKVFIDILKPEDDGSITLLKVITVKSTVAGIFTHILREVDWISVEPGYLLGKLKWYI